jgi:hypothetical protein
MSQININEVPVKFMPEINIGDPLLNIEDTTAKH